MIRPSILRTINPKSDNLLFQIIDWKSYDIYDDDENLEEKDLDNEDFDDEDLDEEDYKKKKKPRRLVIRGYGVTEEGNSICIHIKGFVIPIHFFI